MDFHPFLRDQRTTVSPHGAVSNQNWQQTHFLQHQNHSTFSAASTGFDKDQISTLSCQHLHQPATGSIPISCSQKAISNLEIANLLHQLEALCFDTMPNMFFRKSSSAACQNVVNGISRFLPYSGINSSMARYKSLADDDC